MRRRLCALFVLLVLVPVGCSDDDKKEPVIDDPSPYLRRTSIANVLFNLKLSYNNKNIQRYKECLHEEFTYAFSPSDVGGPHNIPDSWGYADDVLSTTRMFGGEANADGYRCETISVGFMAGTDSPSDLGEGWRKVTLTQIQLNVDTRHKDHGDQLMYQVLGDQEDFYLVQTDEVDQASGTHLWRIVRWEDKPVGLKAATESTTWGLVKAIWL